MQEKKETKSRIRDEVCVIPSEFQKYFDFPFQGIRLDKGGKAFVWLDSIEAKIEIEYDLARFIVFAIKVKIEDLKHGFRQKESVFEKHSIIDMFILYSNCHRTLLAAIGFPFASVMNNNSGADIIEKFFLNHPKLIIAQSSINDTEHNISIISKEKFPLLVNIFITSEDSENLLSAKHSFIVLGKTDSGKFICFHKDGIGDGRPIELTSLDKIIQNESEDDTFDNAKFQVTIASMSTVDAIMEEMLDFADKNQ